MTYIALTVEGKNFIRKVCEGTGNNLLRGKSKYGILPNCDPKISGDKIWVSNSYYNNKQITTNTELGEALIDWYNFYGKQYEMDSNVMAAQAFQESGYNIWTYSTISTASGICQFILAAIFDIIISNKYKETIIGFSDDEIAKITKNISGNIYEFKTYDVSNSLGQKNRAIIHQNVIDNPNIMIKAQFRFMKHIANKCNSLASSTLFGYSRGPAYAKMSYVDSVKSATNEKNYQDEGIDYVYKIFSILGDKENELITTKPKGYYFGYDKGSNNLNMKKSAVFDAYMIKSQNSTLTYDDFSYSEDYNISNYMTYYDAISYKSATSTPERRKYPNVPTNTELNNLINIARTIYDPLCKHFGLKIPITTAFRGEFLNTDVGGVSNSQHRLGEALDLDIVDTNSDLSSNFLLSNTFTSSVSNNDIFYYIANNLPFDQLIWESGNDNNPAWVHVSLKLNSKLNRKEFLLFNPHSSTKYLAANNINDFNKLLT